jgi:hypothetical protein
MFMKASITLGSEKPRGARSAPPEFPFSTGRSWCGLAQHARIRAGKMRKRNHFQ